MTTQPQNVSKRAVLWAACLTSFIGPFMISAVNVGLPQIQHEFTAGAFELGWVSMIYMLSYGALMVPLAKLCDIHGRRRTFFWGLAAIAVSLLGSALAWSLTVLMASRLLSGVGAAMITVSGVPMVVSVHEPSDRGRAIGFITAAVYTGLTAGPFVGGLLVEAWGWRSIFWAGALPSLFCMWLAATKIKAEWTVEPKGPFDILGSVLFSASLALGIYGGPELPGVRGWVCVGLAAVGLVWFVFQELDAIDPVFEVRLFSGNRLFTFASLAHFINYAATISIIFLLSLYLQFGKGLSPQAAGLVLAIQPAIQVIIAPLSGRLSDRIGAGIPASAGMALIAVGLGFLAVLDQNSSLKLIIACQIGLGLGYGLFTTPNMSAIMGSVSQDHFSEASAAVGTLRLSGAVVSMAVATMLISLFMGRAEITAQSFPGFLEAMKTAFTLFCGLSVLGLFFSLARGRGQAA